jgi:hypothetical protein
MESEEMIMAEDKNIAEGAAETVEFANVKTVGEMLSFAAGTAALNLTKHQANCDQITQMYLGNLANKMTSVDPTEAISNLKQLSGNDVAQQIAALSAAVASMQGSLKGAQTTPPVTP